MKEETIMQLTMCWLLDMKKKNHSIRILILVLDRYVIFGFGTAPIRV